VQPEIRWIIPTLCVWQAYEPAVKCELSAAARVTPEGLVFIDPIALPDGEFSALAERARPHAVIVTNGNHARAAGEFRERFGVPVWATAQAAAELELAVDHVLTEAAPAPGGMRVVAIPGAGAGEIALVGDGVATIGDALIHLPGHGFTFLPEKYRTDSGAMLGGLRKLLQFEFQILTFAHGWPLTDSPHHRLAALLA
jgi:hypothetical protein